MSQLQNENDTEFKIGYNGWVKIIAEETSFLLQATNANVTKNVNVPTMSSFYLPFNDDFNTTQEGSGEISLHKPAKSLIRASYGTCTFSGSLQFEVTNSSLGLLSDYDIFNNNNEWSMFKRNSLFDMQFCDGEKICTLRGCAWNSFSFNCQVNSLITASLSFQSLNNYSQKLDISDYEDSGENQFNSEDSLIPYWQAGLLFAFGANDIQYDPVISSLSISFQRNITPVFLNNDYVTPTYLRLGLITINLNVTFLQYFNWDDYRLNVGDAVQALTVIINNKQISLSSPVLMNNSYSMSSMSDAGEKTYQWNSISLNNTENIFKITSS